MTAGDGNPLKQGLGELSDGGVQAQIDELMKLKGKGYGDLPAIEDLMKQRQKAAWGNALIQMGAGIAGGNMQQGLSRAGVVMAKGAEASGDIRLKRRMGQYEAEQKQIDRDIDILTKAGTLNVSQARALMDRSIQHSRDKNEAMRTGQILMSSLLKDIPVGTSRAERLAYAMEIASQVMPAEYAAAMQEKIDAMATKGASAGAAIDLKQFD